MKKLFLLATLFVALFTVSASAQGGPGGMTPEQMAERQKKMKAELIEKAKITEAEADKVLQIQQDYVKVCVAFVIYQTKSVKKD